MTPKPTKQWRTIPPYSQQFLFVVTDEFAGLELIRFYTSKFKYKDEGYWLGLIAAGLVTVNQQAAAPDTILRLGDEIRTKRVDVTEPRVNAEIAILYDQNGLLVLDKKAPIPVHPSGRYYKNSLLHVLRELWPDKTFHTIHRLDKWTTGVLILATDAKMAAHLHKQVEKQRFDKTYGVIAGGAFLQKTFSVQDAIGRIFGAHRGTGPDAQDGKASLTHFEVMQTQTDLTLLKAKPVTGRTNQIRVHVQSAGGYVLNDPLYSPQKPDDDSLDFLGLHCREMSFTLPGPEPLTVQAPWPDEFLKIFPVIPF